MSDEKFFRLLFMLLLLLLLGMRIYFMLLVRRRGGKLLPSAEGIRREGRLAFLLRAVLFFPFLAFLILYCAGWRGLDLFLFPLPAWLRWAAAGLGLISIVFWGWAQQALDRQWSAQVQLTTDH